MNMALTLPAFRRTLAESQKMGFTMSCLERAITHGHAKFSGDGEHACPGRRRLRLAAGRWRAMRETGFETVSCVRGFPRGRGKLRPWRARSPEEYRFHKGGPNHSLPPGTVAQASAPAGCGSVPLPVHGRATTRGGMPLEPQCQAEVRPGTAALRSNDIQPVSKEALIRAIKKMNRCSHRPSPAGGGILVAASGKDFQAPCRGSAAVPGCGCGWRLAASSIAGRDARPTRRRDACATKFTQGLCRADDAGAH